MSWKSQYCSINTQMALSRARKLCWRRKWVGGRGERRLHTKHRKGNMHLILSCPPGLPTVWAHQRTAEGKTVTFWALCVCVCVCVCVLPSENCYTVHTCYQGSGFQRGPAEQRLFFFELLIWGKKGRDVPWSNYFRSTGFIKILTVCLLQSS